MERFKQVNAHIFRGGCPSEHDLNLLKHVWGVKRIVSLDKKIGFSIAPICKSLGLDHKILGINSHNLEQAVSYLKDNVVNLLLDNAPTFVHCRYGKDRTGLVIGMFRVLGEDWKPSEAYQEALSLDFTSGLPKDIAQLYVDSLFSSYTYKPSTVRDRTDIGELARHSLEQNPTRDDSYFSPIYPGDINNLQEKKRRQRRKQVFMDLNEAMAQVGISHNVIPSLTFVTKEHMPHPILPIGYSYIL